MLVGCSVSLGLARSGGLCHAEVMTEERAHEFTDGLYGHITHTEFASSDPEGTKAWAAEVFGWTFQPPFPSPAGDYHLYAYSEDGGGGIRATGEGEQPGSTPTVHVRDTQEAYDKAVAAGAKGVHPPERVMEGVCIAQVRAPGGVLIGLSGPTD